MATPEESYAAIQADSSPVFHRGGSEHDKDVNPTRRSQLATTYYQFLDFPLLTCGRLPNVRSQIKLEQNSI